MILSRRLLDAGGTLAVDLETLERLRRLLGFGLLPFGDSETVVVRVPSAVPPRSTVLVCLAISAARALHWQLPCVLCAVQPWL